MTKQIIKTISFITLIALCLSFSFCSKPLSSERKELYQGFQNPPNEARPRVWWHWLNGNITKEGIRKDLEWMHRIGIGGFHNFDAGLETPQIVEKRLTYMTPEWKEAFLFTTKLADSLGFEMAIAGSPGWSQTGGPWVEPKDGMKKLVWRELRLKGGEDFNGKLPEPYTTTGNFQNIPGKSEHTAEDGKAPVEYYEDVAVIAYKLSEQDICLSGLSPKITSSGGDFNLSKLTDGDITNTTLLPRDDAKGYAWIQYEFTEPQTVKAITIVSNDVRGLRDIAPPANNRSLEISQDGTNYSKLCDIPSGGGQQQTVAVPEATAKYFRFVFQNPVLSRYEMFTGARGKGAAGTDVAELVLHPVNRINHAEEKAGFVAVHDLAEYPTPDAEFPIRKDHIIDLTNNFRNGILEWDVPEGNWKIIRFGYSLKGEKNHPATPEATGLEVDKLDAKAVRAYFENYLNQYKDATGGLMGKKGLQYLLTDSYEAGQMTWTPKMAVEFENRRGYSLFTWLPVITGQIVESSVASEQFLWDWRTTIGELLTENHYDQLTDILNERGMQRYSESHESGRVFMADGMDVKRTAAIPMSAMWAPIMGGENQNMGKADIRESASVAHIYGQNLVAAESMTAYGIMGNAWSYCPENLKPTADLELANGLNRFVIHTSVHQPVDDKIPGLGLSIYGQWFNRHETWAEQARAWTDYLARSSYMLQQGKFVADIVYYYGEDNNITSLFGQQLPDIPEGYNYDFINPQALINLLEVDSGNLVTPSGMNYRMLVLDENTRRMSFPVLQKLVKLANAGAVIVGKRPDKKAGMQGEQEEFNRLVKDIWALGKSNIRENESIQQVLGSLKLTPDFTYSSETDVEVLHVHRKVEDTDIYWVNSRSDQAELISATFRVSGKKPEIWHPETGEKSDASYSIQDGMTTVSLDLKPNDAVFVVFEQPTKEHKVELPWKDGKEIRTVEGPWNIAFQAERGAPESAVFDELNSYTENQDKRIKYFSGTATYTKIIPLSGADIASGNLYLDLGEVKNLAEVYVNGQNLGILWKKPFRVDITKAVKAGENKLEIKVTNLWVNRLIGDAQPDVTEKITYTTIPFYQADSPLKSSGLMGPVSLISLTKGS